MKKTMQLLASGIALAASVGANAAVVDFESGLGGGFSWDNFGVLNSTSSTYNGSGYRNGTVSGSHVAYNSRANPAALSSFSSFVFNGAYFAGAWNNGLNITVRGFLGGVETLSETFVVNTDAPLWRAFGWTVDRLVFSSAGGVDQPGLNGSGAHFAMDNFTYNEVLSPVPEPETYAMLGVGLGLLGAFARRRKQAA